MISRHHIIAPPITSSHFALRFPLFVSTHTLVMVVVVLVGHGISIGVVGCNLALRTFPARIRISYGMPPMPLKPFASATLVLIFDAHTNMVCVKLSWTL